jgi:carbamoyl-phosphate synthase large subunit
MTFNQKKIFISGGAGVIGTEIVDILLSQGALLFVGDLKPCPEKWYNKLTYFHGDLNNISFEEINSFEPEYFIHLAATFERSTETYDFWQENFRNNVQLSNHLMTIIKEIKSVVSVVYASSYLIYDPKLYTFEVSQEVPYQLKETDNIYPRNLTGMAKLSHEIELRFLDLFKNNQFKISIPRIFRGYGKNSRDIISRWVRLIMNNEEISVYRQEGIFDYIYAKDTAKGILKIAESKISGIINLGTGKARKVSDVINILKSHFPNINARFIESDILYEASQADVSLLKDKIGWIPEFTIEDGIKEIIEFEKSRISKTTTTPGNILISSSSKKIGLIKSVVKAAKRISNDIKVISGDSNINAISKYFSDDFYHMPKTVENNKNEILKWCKKNCVTAIIPTRDGELLFWSNWKKELFQNGILVMVPNPEAVETCLDKFLFSSRCSQLKLPVINSSLSIQDIKSSSYVVKERYGAGSQSIGLNVDLNLAIDHAKRLESPLFQPFITGREISVDSYITLSGEVKGLITRNRTIVENGESVITDTFFDEDLTVNLTSIISKLNLYGHVILQVIIDSSNNINIVECNSRFGGASTLSIESGLDSFYWFILEANGEDLDKMPFQIKKQKLKQIRFPQDLIVYGSSI